MLNAETELPSLLEKLLDNEELRTAAGKKALQHVEENRGVTGKHLDLVKEVVGDV